MTPAEIKAGLRARASQSVPWAGMALERVGARRCLRGGSKWEVGRPGLSVGRITAGRERRHRARAQIDLEDTVTASAKTEEPATITASKSNRPRRLPISQSRAPNRLSVAAE